MLTHLSRRLSRGPWAVQSLPRTIARLKTERSRQFPFHAIRKDEHDHVEAEVREVLEEDWFAEAAQECPPLGEEGLVAFVSYDQVQVEIGILVGGSCCVRTTDEGGYDARVFSTGSHETVECLFSITSDNQGSTPFPSNA